MCDNFGEISHESRHCELILLHAHRTYQRVNVFFMPYTEWLPFCWWIKSNVHSYARRTYFGHSWLKFQMVEKMVRQQYFKNQLVYPFSHGELMILCCDVPTWITICLHCMGVIYASDLTSFATLLLLFHPSKWNQNRQKKPQKHQQQQQQWHYEYTYAIDCKFQLKNERNAFKQHEAKYIINIRYDIKCSSPPLN